MTNLTANIQIGDFIEIPYNHISGLVVCIHQSQCGSAVKVTLETNPEGDTRQAWIEDDDFINWLQ